MPRLPNRWLNYSSYGNVVADTFVAMKVPLAQKFCLEANERFTPADVLATLPIGLVVDLTDTKRYYDPVEFTSNGVAYQKLNVRGHLVPDVQIVRRFIAIVKDFLANSCGHDKLIGVHCTHGLNRTGYLMCAYLILELGHTPKHAIALFNEKRGHEMERRNYLESLHSIFDPKPTSGGRQHRSMPTAGGRYHDSMPKAGERYHHSIHKAGGRYHHSRPKADGSRHHRVFHSTTNADGIRIPRGRYAGFAKRTFFE